jgi:molybdenum cofactor guanylyltransferase
MPRLSGVVLAGGQSRRMGSDKALLRVDGARLVDRAVAVLQECCDQVVVASGDGRRLNGLGVDQIADASPGAGPLAGILAGLERARHPLVAVVAVDMPGADAGVLRLLARSWDGEAVVLPRAEGRLQPLHAVWSRACARDLRRLLEQGERSVNAVAQRLGIRVVEPGEWSPVAASSGFAHNLNTPRDLGSAGL